MNNVTIIDNAVSQDLADLLENEMCTRVKHGGMAWFFSDVVTFKEEKYLVGPHPHIYKFSHIFFENGAPKSAAFPVITPILDLLKCDAIVNIRAFLTTYTGSAYQGAFHTDTDCTDPTTIKHRYTAIYYVNTNNGYTLFEDGQRVESVKNRLCIFPFYNRHAVVTATDVKARAVINFNYWRLNE